MTAKSWCPRAARCCIRPRRSRIRRCFGGSSEAAHELAAEQLDVYLTWGEPPEAVARKIADVRERAARHGRSVKFGCT